MKRMLSDFFGGKDLNMPTNPDEAVAYGAAQAANLSDVQSDRYDRCDDKALCQREAPPSRNQHVINISVFEGEHDNAKGNNKLVEFEISGIPPAPRGVPQIDVCFIVNTNSILDVSAKAQSYMVNMNGVDGKLHKFEALKFKRTDDIIIIRTSQTQSLASPRKVQMAYIRQNKLPT
eukprot:XP_011666812.1 PREDICTED: heat shock 70 kDa protein-like [Strongylocentrotus purpuratus]